MNPNKYNPEAIGAKEDGKFENFRDFVAALARDGRGHKDTRLRFIGNGSEISAALTGEEVELGGALVPEEFRASLMMLELQSATIRSRAMVLPMSSATMTLPAIRNTDHSSGQTFGGVRFYWLERGDTIPENEPEFMKIRLMAKGLLGITSLDNFFITDSFSAVGPLISRLWGMAVPWEEERTFIRGGGAGEPLGLLNAPASVKVTRTTAAGIFDVDDLASMEGRTVPGGSYAWYMHPGVRTALYHLNSDQVQSWHPALAEGAPDMLNGRPIIYHENCSAPGSEGDVILVNWDYYIIGGPAGSLDGHVGAL